ncbi:MAG: ribbon-helix-helix domain-containing protein [Thermaceae bacterium]|nr:ribbon-helix-helix domain-containing protein [Thermaceae bacterium]
MIRKQIYLAPEQEAKLKRLARATGRSEAEIIREALEALPESTDPVLAALLSQGVIEAPTVSLSPAQAENAYQRYLQQIGSRRLGLSRAVLEERQG